MAYSSNNVKNDSAYVLGGNIGYLAAFLVFATVFYLILQFLKKLPEIAKYYHVLIIVAVLYIARLIALKLIK
jgi:hypothetical protein